MRSWWPDASPSLNTAALIATSLRTVMVALLPWSILRQRAASRRQEAVLLGLGIGSLLSVLRGGAELVNSWLAG